MRNRAGRSDAALRNRSRISWRRQPANTWCSSAEGAPRSDGSPASAALSEAVRADSPGRFRGGISRRLAFTARLLEGGEVRSAVPNRWPIFENRLVLPEFHPSCEDFLLGIVVIPSGANSPAGRGETRERMTPLSPVDWALGMKMPCALTVLAGTGGWFEPQRCAENARRSWEVRRQCHLVPQNSSK